MIYNFRLTQACSANTRDKEKRLGFEMNEFEFIQILEADGTWDALKSDWKKQAEELGEDFDSYAGELISVLQGIIVVANPKAAVYALRREGKHAALCQLNCTLLPKFTGPVLRLRFLTLSPEYDLVDQDLNNYAKVLISLFYAVIRMSVVHDHMRSSNIKMHLPSPNDRQFFAALGHSLGETKLFKSVDSGGAWLHISRE